LSSLLLCLPLHRQHDQANFAKLYTHWLVAKLT